jgi:hypothetical protein
MSQSESGTDGSDGNKAVHCGIGMILRESGVKVVRTRVRDGPGTMWQSSDWSIRRFLFE